MNKKKIERYMIKNYFIKFIYLIIFSNELFSNSYGDIYGAHARANGMGNAVTAIVNDSSAVFYNPAGLGRDNLVQEYEKKINSEKVSMFPFITKDDKLKNNKVPVKNTNEKVIIPEKKEVINTISKKGFHNELAIHGNLTQPLLKSTGGQSEDIKNIKDSYTGLGLSIDLNNFIKLKRNARFGLNIILPATGNLLALNDVNAVSPRYFQNGRSLERPTIMGAVGIEIWKDKLFAGVGFTALVQGQGSALLKNLELSPKQTTPNQQVILDVKPLINPTFGLMFKWKNFSLGGNYKREIYAIIDPINARAQTAILGIQLDLKLALQDHFTPKMINYGVAYLFKEKYLFSVDVNRELWSEFNFSSAKKIYSEPVFLKDVSNPRAGFEYSFRNSIKFRMGYGRRINPLKLMPGENNLIDFDRRITSVGFSYYFFPKSESIINTPIVLDLIAEQQSLNSIVNYKYFPTRENPSFVASGKIYHFGFSLTVFF